MYNLLIIDDEILELETLRDYVDWNSFGISVVATAKNGRDALIKFIEHKPDLVITDVKMPIMDGIEFSKKLREVSKNTKLIFLTGYDDFSYAKSALNVHASGYILKPFSIEELTDVINSVIKELEKDKLTLNSVKLYVENKLRFLLNNTDRNNVQKIINQLKEIESPLFHNNNYNYNLLLVYINIDDPSINKAGWKDVIYSLDKDAQIIVNNSFTANNSFTVILVNSKIFNHLSIIDFAQMVQTRLVEKGFPCSTIIYSEEELSLENLGLAYSKLSSLEENLFYCDKSCLINASKFHEPNTIDIKLPSIDNKISEALFTYDKDNVHVVIDGYFDFITKNKVKKSITLEAVFNFLLYIWEDFLKHNLDINPDYIKRNNLWNKLMECKDISEVYKLTLNSLDRIADYLIEKQKDKNQYVVDKILKFIEINYGKPITITDVAQHIYLSPNYVRNIFKEKTGETFLEYLTAFRMKKAAELLKNKSLKVHEVSNMVSYENVSYFCSIFAKNYGASPNEYRNKY